MIKKIITLGLHLGKSRTARDIYWVFSGNAASIVLTFFTTILIANSISKAENGIFLALFTLANLLSELGEAGLGAALTSFIPRLQLEEKYTEMRKLVNTVFTLELCIALVVMVVLSAFAKPIAIMLFENTMPAYVVLTALITFTLVMFSISTWILSSYKQFREVATVNIFYSLIRLGFIFGVAVFSKLHLLSILISYLGASLLAWVYSFLHLKVKLRISQIESKEVSHLFRFSSILAVQKVFVAVSSRLDLLMLVPLSGAVEAGVYGIASRFSMVYPLLISSLSQVFAPKFAEFARGRDALTFLKKSVLVIGVLLISMYAFYLVARPLLTLLVPKYVDAVPVFQALLLAMSPFVAAVPFTSLLVYTFKKPVVTTVASLLQLLIIFGGNMWFVPQYGRFGPAISIGLGNAVVLFIALFASWYYVKTEK